MFPLDKIVAIIRKYSSRQSERAWNLPFPVLDVLDGDHVRRVHEPSSCDRTFNAIILFFEKVDTAVVKHNECYDENFSKIVDANTMVTNQEIVHKRLYDCFARWWRQARPDGVEDIEFNIDANLSVDNSLPGFLLINFLLERCALPIVFDAMQQIKPMMEGLYGERVVDIYNANDEVIADETDHGRQYLECWQLVKDQINGKRFEEVRSAIWNVIEPIFAEFEDADEYLVKYNKLSECEDVYLRYMADAQSGRPFEGARIGYVNNDHARNVAELAKDVNTQENINLQEAIEKLGRNCEILLSRIRGEENVGCKRRRND